MRLSPSIALLLLPALLPAADPLASLPRTTEVAVHLNARKFIDSAEYKRIIAKPEAEQPMRGIQALRVFGLDVEKDIDRIRIAGRVNQDEWGSVRVEGRIPVDKLLAIVMLNPTYKKETVGTTEVHSWKDEGDDRAKFATIEGTSAVTVANSREALVELIEAAADPAKSLAAAEKATPRIAFARPTIAPTSSPATVTSSDANDLLAWGFIFRPERECELGEAGRKLSATAATATVDLTAEGLAATVTLVAENPAKANDWREVVAGVLAFGRLQQENKALQEAAGKARVTAGADPRTVTIGAGMDSAAIAQLIDDPEAFLGVQ